MRFAIVAILLLCLSLASPAQAQVVNPPPSTCAWDSPLDSDSDNDGILDGDDVEWLQNAINALPASAFKDNGKGPGARYSILIDSIESLVALGNTNTAIAQVQILRTHVDGCGVNADNNDWIVDCTAQVQIRSLLDLYISNLGS